ncbi:MAG: sporulation protein Cse60 [Thermacetogeniaceae bacterium]|jgi:hypothetical protein
MAKTESCLVKLFSEIDVLTLERNVNDFLKQLAGRNFVLDIKYGIAVQDGQVVYSVMVTYIDSITKK